MNKKNNKQLDLFAPKAPTDRELRYTQEHQACFQYRKREEKAQEEASNPYWKDLDLDLGRAEIRPVERSFAQRIVEDYEWLGCMPAISLFHFGIFFGETCGGVVVFGPDYSENLGTWDKYGYTGKIILLSRGVCLHWTPKNTNSRLVMGAISLLPPQYEVVTATVDPLAGEIGVIYQACNFVYCGVMRKNKKRIGVLIDGKLLGSRTLRAKLGTIKKEVILAHYPNAQFVEQASKHRYFLFRGSKKAKKAHLAAIQDRILPYPKKG